MIEQPPKIENKDIQKAIKLLNNIDVSSLVDKINNEYEYWSEVKYKQLPDNVSHKELWASVKISRMLQQAFIWNKYGISVGITNKMQRICHEFDMNFGGLWGANSLIPEENKEQYLISSLMEEAISSSQMEGASTTRKVAKDMLRKSLSPKSRSEQMIFNNYKTIQFITEHKSEQLTPQLLRHIHSLMTTKTLDNTQDEGQYRATNDVVVEDSLTHEVVHTPPPFEEIPQFVDDLCTFFNEENSSRFIHPIIRGIIIHFMVAYVHPFVDGNGRTARALFYWYMLRRGYWLTEYLSISRIIYKSKASYERAYLYVEADENDMGYFILYNLRVLKLAFDNLKLYIQRKLNQKSQTTDFLRLGNINERQAAIMELIFNNSKISFTIKELQNRFAISHTTAKNDVDLMVERGLLEEIPLNRVKKGYIKGSLFDEIVKR